MRRDSSRLRRPIFVGLVILLLGVSVATASASVTVYIYEFNKPVTWKGERFNGGTYWGGEIHIQHGGIPPDGGTHARAYCMEYDVLLRTGRSYEYTAIAPATDDAKWKSIAYILSWYDPPGTDSVAAQIQGAIWQILTSHDPSGKGSALASEANGKDVLRDTDTFEWVTPGGIVLPGEQITLTVRITKSGSNGRPNVKVEFKTTAGTLDKNVGYTDSNGEVSVTLTAPQEMGIVQVSAHSRGVWPDVYLYTSCTQDLIGIGDIIGLTTTADLLVITQIHVVPEIPFGTFTAVATCFFAYIIKVKRANPPLPRT